MNGVATITSKRQLTVPAKIFAQVGLRTGQRVILEEKNGRIILTPSEFLVEELAGSVPAPKEWKGRDIDEIVESARNEYYLEKYSSK